MTQGLSKSRYTQFKCCDKALWLGVNKPKLAVITDAQQAIFDTGSGVGDLAMGLLGDYEEMTELFFNGRLNIPKMIEKTQEALSRGVVNICEAAFSFNGNYCAVDILHKTDDGYEIYEVKSSTSADKEIYGWDLAFQKYVLVHCGINVTGTYLVCINNQYVRQGEIELEKLFKINDLTEAVDNEYPNVATTIEQAIRTLEGEEPEKPISMACHSPYPCIFWEYCAKNVPTPSVLNLYRMKWEDRFAHYNAGRATFMDVKDVNLSEIQSIQVDNTLAGTNHIDKAGIQSFLDTLTYPLYYLDFESIMPAIPLFDGTRPYQQLTTQYSLHIQEEPRGELSHREFLAPSRENPLRPLAETLCRDIPTNVDVVVYNKGFECTRLRELAKMFPDLADHLLAIRDNVKDLLTPFNKGYYYLPAMGGSFSIKSVLPALFPNDPKLDYHSLDRICQNGSDAMNLFPQLQYMNQEDEINARDALLDYCRLDTLAMVKVLDKLYEAAEN